MVDRDAFRDREKWLGYLYENNYELGHLCEDGWEGFIERKYHTKVYICDRCNEGFSLFLFGLQIRKALEIWGARESIEILVPVGSKHFLQGSYQ